MSTTPVNSNLSRCLCLVVSFPGSTWERFLQVLPEYYFKAEPYLLPILLVGCLQKLQDMRLERIAEALPIPILMESRRRKIQRFLSLAILSIEKIWFSCLKEFLKNQKNIQKVV